MHFLDNQNGRNLLGVFGHVKIEDGACEVFFLAKSGLGSGALGVSKSVSEYLFLLLMKFGKPFQLSAMHWVLLK